MRQVAIFEYGGPEVLQVIETPVPVPGPDDVLVEMIAAGINPVDYKMRQGKSKWVEGFTDFPFTPGSEGVGTVAAIGSNVSDFAVGDLVYGTGTMEPKKGCHGEFAIFPARLLAPAPSDVDHLVLGGTPMTALTAWTSVHELAKVTSSDRVLIHGAGGGVGQWLVQFCVTLGATVYASASTRHAQRLAELGATHVDYTTQDVFAALDGPVDVVLDCVYFDTFEASLDHLAIGGRVVVMPTLADISPALDRGIEAHVARVNPDPSALVTIGQGLSDGSLSAEIAQVFSMENLAEAHRILEDGHAPGKLVLDLRH